MKGKIFALIAASILAIPAFAHHHTDTHKKTNKNTLNHCLIQEVLPGKNMTAAFFTLRHHGSEQTLIAAEIPSVTNNVQLHSMTMKDGVMAMEEMKDGYSLKTGENHFAKGGNHLMLMDISKPPKVGSKHKLTLIFKDGSKVSCKAIVKSVDDIMKMTKGEKKMPMSHEHHKDMPSN